LVHARDFLGRIRDLKSIAANDTLSGELRLGAVQTAKAGLLPDILSGMAKKYPQVEIHIVGDMPAPLYAKVLSGELDAAVAEGAFDCIDPRIGIDPRSQCCLGHGALHSTGPHGLGGTPC